MVGQALRLILTARVPLAARTIIRFILLALMAWAVYSALPQLRNLPRVLAQGDVRWVAAAVLFQIACYRLWATLYQNAFDVVEVPSSVTGLLPVVFSSMFVDLAVPSFGLSGAALLLDDAAQRGQSSARALAGIMLVRILDLISFGALGLLGLSYLIARQSLQDFEVVAAVLSAVALAGLLAVMAVALWRRPLLERWLATLAGVGNTLALRTLHTRPFTDEWVAEHAEDFCAAVHLLSTNRRRLPRGLGCGLMAHLCNLVSLGMLFRAFHQPLEVGALVAALAVGYLLLLFDLALPASGAVEASMALLFYSLGATTDVALTVALCWRGISFWVPAGVGFLLMQSGPAYGPLARSRAQRWSVRTVSVLVGLMGLLDALAALRPTYHSRLVLLSDLVPFHAREGARLAAILAGFALLVLASNLWRRKRLAWTLSLLMLLVSVFSHLLHGLDYETASVALALAVWLWKLRPQFHARSDPPSMRRGLEVLAVALVFTVCYGTLGFYFLDRRAHQPVEVAAALRQTLVMITQFYDPGQAPHTWFGRLFCDSLYGIMAGAAVFAIWNLFKPVFARRAVSPADVERAWQIVQLHGHSSMARFTLFDDKLHWFSPGGSLVAYAVAGHVAVVLGDPIGPASDFDACLAGFQEFCATNDWDITFYQVLDEHLAQYRAAGFKTLAIGEEAIIDLKAFTLQGSTYKSLRGVMNKLTKLGFHAEVLEPPLSDAVVTELRQISNEWLGMMHGTEKKFSLGAFDDDYIRNAPVCVVRTPQGVISAFVNLVPEYQKNELTADLMRRRTVIENGTMDFMFGTLFSWAKEKGYESYNLGLSPLAGVGDAPQDPVAERALHYIYEHVNQFYNFKGLHQFKEKFHPSWSQRYLVFPSAGLMPAISMALMRVHSGDEFILDFARDFVADLKRKRAARETPPAAPPAVAAGGPT
jgi:phosphatidylglycerol lysyltransferase